jgi:hypothetical protein
MSIVPWLVEGALAGSSSVADHPRPIAGHEVLDLRAGYDRVDDLSHPYICLQGMPLGFLAIEACGTGAGVLHHDDSSDMAHFRAKAEVLELGQGRLRTTLMPGIGFAEIQRTTDRPGFKFGKADAPEPVEAAGAEASLSLQGRYWVDPGARTYVIGVLDGGAALIPAAPDVIGSGGPVVPFASFTVGMGF